eukprot:TRINITY_DN51963_c0_g1_i1.p1 TRINITY_DN51963_c0_g1~~TRINITY_DN51963_c0_g1_i1.p1  ORF type:complete len:330 (-),score=59.57 TRINITY_DN51963_c0_g1_i1:139-1128(-)
MSRHFTFLVVQFFTQSFGCPFGGQWGEDLPEGHPWIEFRKLKSTNYPGYIVDDKASNEGSLSTIWPPKKSESQTAKFKALTKKSADLGDAELCYWSFQTLPGPQMRQASPTVTDADVDLWFQNVPSGEASNFADMAVKRMQKLVQPGGPVVWTGCGVGRTLRNAMCQKGKAVSTTAGGTLSDCSKDAVKNQELLTPTAIVIFKIKASEANKTWDLLMDWRSSSSGHALQMQSKLVQVGGWGAGGQIISKLTRCSEIPARFKYQNLGDCDQMGQSKLLADEAFAVWRQACNLLKSDCGTTVTTTAATTATSTPGNLSGASPSMQLYSIQI